MRMRRIPWAEDFLREEPSVIKDLEAYKGNWKSKLNKEILHVEIGMGKGDYCIQMSTMYPNIGWIGIEKNESVAAIALKKHLEVNNSNILYLQQDAKNLCDFFDKGEVDVIHLNFSDPWPKRRTTKRRLSSPLFLKSYDHVLASDGELHMKTDNRSLFEYSLVSMATYGYCLHEVQLDFRSEVHDEDAISEYERKFIEKGQPIYRAVWKRGKQL